MTQDPLEKKDQNCLSGSQEGKEYSSAPQQASEASGASGKLQDKGISRRARRQRPNIDVEAYWLERRNYLEQIKQIPELKTRFIKAMTIYLFRRFLWSFGFFPVFLAVWIPLILNRFNPVATVSNLLPHLERFVQSNPEAQAGTMQTIWLAWFSIGFIFAVFDFVLTPYKSPYDYEADVHMRAWEQLQQTDKL